MAHTALEMTQSNFELSQFLVINVNTRKTSPTSLKVKSNWERVIREVAALIRRLVIHWRLKNNNRSLE